MRWSDLRGDWVPYNSNYVSKKYKTYTKRRVSSRSVICTNFYLLYSPGCRDMDTFSILMGGNVYDDHLFGLSIWSSNRPTTITSTTNECVTWHPPTPNRHMMAQNEGLTEIHRLNPKLSCFGSYKGSYDKIWLNFVTCILLAFVCLRAHISRFHLYFWYKSRHFEVTCWGGVVKKISLV
jgi:hypothetical protein